MLKKIASKLKGGRDNRLFDRMEFHTELVVSADNPMLKRRVEYYGVTINISKGGILFRSIAEFSANIHCVVKFVSRRSKDVELRGRILRINREERPEITLKANEKLFAVEFSQPLSNEELGEILNLSVE